MNNVKVDFADVIGKIKPLHGMNNAARKTGYGELLPAFLELNSPIVRLHDTCGTYGGSHYVDVPNIFPDFEADPSDENSYDFTLTDCYLRELHNAGIRIFYRLGVTIEHEPKKYRIYPPRNAAKWADICEHIVRHYNDGWAQGFDWNIEYWEIWNEPDGIAPDVEPYGPPNWLGSAEDYYKLYSVTANHIKKLHPEIKIGGYASCHILGAFFHGHWEKGLTGFFTGFLDYITSPATKAPLDFFSWHGYRGRGPLTKIAEECDFVRNTLEKYGLRNVELIDDEWNCNICDIETDDVRTQNYINMRSHKGAAYDAGALYEMQRCSIDMAMYYDAQLWCSYGGLFNVPSLTPSKAYYSFLQFSELYSLGSCCRTEAEYPIYTCAATGKYDMLALSNISDKDEPVTAEIKNVRGKTADGEILDETRNLEPFGIAGSEKITFTMPAYSVVSIKFYR